MTRQISERTVDLLPQSRVVVIPGVDHALPLQDPEAIAGEVAAFVRDHGGRAEA